MGCEGGQIWTENLLHPFLSHSESVTSTHLGFKITSNLKAVWGTLGAGCQFQTPSSGLDIFFACPEQGRVLLLSS